MYSLNSGSSGGIEVGVVNGRSWMLSSVRGVIVERVVVVGGVPAWQCKEWAILACEILMWVVVQILHGDVMVVAVGRRQRGEGPPHKVCHV